jgi:NAD(P)H-dependent FMN reductase
MLNLLAFAASARKESLNKLLIDEAVDLARDGGASIQLYQFQDFEMPLYNGDLEREIILPPGAKLLCKLLTQCDGLMISTPEYNFSMPGTLKNAIDWVSRPKPTPLLNKTCFLMSASPSLVGGQRCLWAVRQPLESIGTLVYPSMYSLPQADKAFDTGGRLIDEKRRETLKKQIEGFLGYAQALAPR